MKDEITIPIIKKEDFVVANKRRDNYAVGRDIKAMEFNAAIVTRMKAEIRNEVKCEKCGKEFAAGISARETLICPDCIKL
jgi:hypothetical protein